MPYVIECQECGYSELHLDLKSDTVGVLMRFQESSLKDGKKGLCYMCKGRCKIHQLKFKILQKIIVRFPGNIVIRTWMKWEQVANGEGEFKNTYVFDKKGRKEYKKYRM